VRPFHILDSPAFFLTNVPMQYFGERTKLLVARKDVLSFRVIDDADKTATSDAVIGKAEVCGRLPASPAQTRRPSTHHCSDETKCQMLSSQLAVEDIVPNNRSEIKLPLETSTPHALLCLRVLRRDQTQYAWRGHTAQVTLNPRAALQDSNDSYCCAVHAGLTLATATQRSAMGRLPPGTRPRRRHQTLVSSARPRRR
jgi:hypothetical protein